LSRCRLASLTLEREKGSVGQHSVRVKSRSENERATETHETWTGAVKISMEISCPQKVTRIQGQGQRGRQMLQMLILKHDNDGSGDIVVTTFRDKVVVVVERVTCIHHLLHYLLRYQSPQEERKINRRHGLHLLTIPHHTRHNEFSAKHQMIHYVALLQTILQTASSVCSSIHSHGCVGIPNIFYLTNRGKPRGQGTSV
jgi:hypothetical protein